MCFSLHSYHDYSYAQRHGNKYYLVSFQNLYRPLGTSL